MSEVNVTDDIADSTKLNFEDYDVKDPHDRFFRQMMSNLVIAQQYFQRHLPDVLAAQINYSTLTMLDTSFVSPELSKYASDVVYECELLSINPDFRQDSGNTEQNETLSKHLIDQPKSQLKIVLLIEHQSSIDKFMPYRVFQYMFNLFDRQFRQRKLGSQKLTPVYPMIFYNGKRKDYRYPLELADCFDDPLNIMRKVLVNPIRLINTNHFDDEELRQQKLLGLMTKVMKFRNINGETINYLIEIFYDLHLLVKDKQELKQFLRPIMAYLWSVGQAEDLQLAIERNYNIPEDIRGEYMTAAEFYTQKGELLGLEKVAVNGLLQGFDIESVVKLTDLDASVVEQLKKQIDTGELKNS